MNKKGKENHCAESSHIFSLGIIQVKNVQTYAVTAASSISGLETNMASNSAGAICIKVHVVK